MSLASFQIFIFENDTSTFEPTNYPDKHVSIEMRGQIKRLNSV